MVDIIVVGYPKSGNTWVTRLVAELVGCPVVGLLGSNRNEIAREGLDRRSPYQCFKSHRQFNELLDVGTNNAKKVIYVIRDPRDICLSGARYFRFDRFLFLSNYMSALRMGRRIYKKINDIFPATSEYRIEQMMQAVLFGSMQVHRAVRIPWRDHYKPFMDNQCFFVKYEDLLDHPEQECRRILSFLAVERDEREIKAAIDVQSFRNKKENFLKMGEVEKASFMKVGKKGQWREGLSEKQKDVFNRMLSEDFARFGYPLV